MLDKPLEVSNGQPILMYINKRKQDQIRLKMREQHEHQFYEITNRPKKEFEDFALNTNAAIQSL